MTKTDGNGFRVIGNYRECGEWWRMWRMVEMGQEWWKVMKSVESVQRVIKSDENGE